MKIHVHHIDEKTVKVTLSPGWLGRMFGGKVRRGIAVRNHVDDWRWKATGRQVGESIEREIECTTVEDLPRAEVASATPYCGVCRSFHHPSNPTCLAAEARRV